MRSFPAIVLPLGFSLLVLAPSALADLQTYQLSGVVNSTDAVSIPVGSALSVTFMYDNGALNTGGCLNCKYFTSPVGQILADAAGADFQTGSPLNMEAVHGAGFGPAFGVPGGTYDFLDVSGVDVSRHLIVVMDFLDSDQSAFATSLDLPTTFPIAEFESILFRAFVPEGSGPKQITGLLAPIPEPTGSVLLLTVVAACASIRRMARVR